MQCSFHWKHIALGNADLHFGHVGEGGTEIQPKRSHISVSLAHNAIAASHYSSSLIQTNYSLSVCEMWYGKANILMMDY